MNIQLLMREHGKKGTLMHKKLCIVLLISLSMLCLGFVNTQQVYCKYCGKVFHSVQAMAHATCHKTAAKKHILYEGVITKQYHCLWCGTKHPSLQAMANSRCYKNPFKKTYHEPYEGTEKPHYICQYCGMQYHSLQAMAHAPCHKNPIGRHYPAR